MKLDYSYELTNPSQEKKTRHAKIVPVLVDIFLFLVIIASCVCLFVPGAQEEVLEFGSVLSALWKPFDLNYFLHEPPAYKGKPVVKVNRNRPLFTEDELQGVRSVSYSELDNLNRCGAAIAYLGPETLPSEKRSSIGTVRPSGWQTVRYDDLIEDKYLYNRCHLIGYQLAGENADPRNLITGTRYLNISGMLPYENMIYEFITKTQDHVLYRVTPVFQWKNLLASGVLMEAISVEDHGKGLSFCVYAFNVQPDILIDYETGYSSPDTMRDRHAKYPVLIYPLPAWEDADGPVDRSISDRAPDTEVTYVLNTNTMRFHDPSCQSVDEMKAANRQLYYGTREDLINDGYVPCGRCKP